MLDDPTTLAKATGWVYMIVSETDRKRLEKIKRGIPYGATRADLVWLVRFIEKLLKERAKQ